MASPLLNSLNAPSRRYRVRWAVPALKARYCCLITHTVAGARRNARADARQDIAAQRVPVMVLMGAQDLNVSSTETLTVWSRLLPVTTSRCLREVKDATHGLLRAKWFNYQLSEQWPRWAQWGFLAAGQYAYAPGALDAIPQWILARRC